jgi:hypothetical protein
VSLICAGVIAGRFVMAKNSAIHLETDIKQMNERTSVVLRKCLFCFFVSFLKQIAINIICNLLNGTLSVDEVGIILEMLRNSLAYLLISARNK